MIAYLNGKILKKTGKEVILETGNIGYLVHLPVNLLAEVAENSTQSFFIHTHVREDMLDLYGFSNFEDLSFFKTLLGISGIGPKVASDILSVPSEKIKTAILNEDLAAIQKIKGVGPKSAKRIILELKGKLVSDNNDREASGLNWQINNDVIDALMKLGYQKHQIMRVLNNLPEEIKEAEEIITYFLKH